MFRIFQFTNSFNDLGGKASNGLLKVDLTIYSNDECTDGYRNDISLKDGIVESQLCAGDSTGEKDTCQVENLFDFYMFAKYPIQ